MKTGNSRLYRLQVIVLLTLCNFINAVDRTSLSVAVPFIIKDFHINTATMGVALSAFFWTYLLCNVPAGNLADRFGSKKVLGWSLGLWSVFSAVTGFAQNVVHIMLARIGVGMGESAVLPCNAKIAANNFPSSERATVMAVALCGIRLGNAAAPIIMAFLIQRWGWREAFIVTGLGSLLWCVVWYFGFKESSTNTTAAAKARERVKVPWKVIATNKTLLNLTVVKFAQDYLMTVFTTWVPAYLIMGRGFSVVTMGFYMSAAYADVGHIPAARWYAFRRADQKRLESQSRSQSSVSGPSANIIQYYYYRFFRSRWHCSLVSCRCDFGRGELFCGHLDNYLRCRAR